MAKGSLPRVWDANLPWLELKLSPDGKRVEGVRIFRDRKID
jgi:hypothetical protein